jgi:hypothetical protein
MRKTTTLAFMLVMLAVPPVAPAAARVIAPPGNSEADQYYQTLPASTGPRAPDSTKEARDAVRDGALTEATEQGLRHRGPTGLSLATAIAKTAPPGGAGRDDAGSVSPIPTVRIPDQQGLGVAFPLILLIAAAGAVAFAVARRRGIVTR